MTAKRKRFPASSLPRHIDVLLVEDSSLEVELTLKPLRELDAVTHIEVARDGEEALDFMFGRGSFRKQAGVPLPRLVLLDLKLPRLDGLDVVRAVRGNARTSLTPIVVLTSSQDPRELAQCYQAGANSCVQKPVRYEEFWATMQAVGRYWLGLNQSPPPPSSPVT
jgi:two-component system response regulator